MSSTGTIDVQRYPNPRKNTNRSVGWFTSLCKGEDNLLHDNKNSTEIVPNPNIKSTFSIHYNNDQLNIDLNAFIEKYKTKIKIEKINFVQIYNIFMNYKYNFTKSDFILCDTRNDLKEKNQALFLKQFPQINYNIKELEILSKNRLIKFFKFINNKKIIFILKDSKEENSIDTIEKFVIFFLANSNNCKIDTIYIAHSDRFIRFGFDWFKDFLESKCNTRIEVINNVSMSPEAELVQDLISIIHVFSCRIYGLRKYKKKIQKDMNL
jgi:hypothetical protein